MTSVSYTDIIPSPEAASNWGFFQIALVIAKLAFTFCIFV